MPATPAEVIHGYVSPGFEAVRDEFRGNFARRGELGAACAVYHRGELVVDLWGGVRDAGTGAPWERETLVTIFSTTKGLAAIALAVAHSRGFFDLGEPVASYWPEFAQGGKARVTVRQLLAHQAGLSAVDEPLDVEVLADLDRVARIIAPQRPAWRPGERHGYHGLTLGLYENELLRRTDPGGRSLGRFLEEEVAGRLGVEFYIGLPSRIPAERVATIKAFHPLRMLLHLGTLPPKMVLSLGWPRSLTARSLLNPRMRGPGDMDSPAYRAIEFPSGSGVAQARALAKAYGVLANGGRELSISAGTLAELFGRPSPPAGGMRDRVLGVETAYSFGFWKPCAVFPYGTSDQAFGGMGAGGSIAFADPDHQLGFAYVMNRMGFHFSNDPRERALRKACYHCVMRK